VATVVCSGVFVDIDKNNILVICVFFDPVSIDEYFLPAHVVSSPDWYVAKQPRVRVRMAVRGRRRRAAATRALGGQARDDESASTFAAADTTTNASGRGLQHAGA
jgi:hypothetical protein